ncbi:DUF6415 family natural product biosynthesis protein [Streptomyces sp. NBC_01236]|uniref:DUF6415 family natural product biosynthesis protein n=1 Tax=Streptomyces sp. NBC_01236 TaxID=2903789 RepID=UPI002E114886|nr:DUF6415 family natural product biosynthesis protein [Streptomyces sp. NBC_01236]
MKAIAETGTSPVDVATMRQTIALLLPPDEDATTVRDTSTLTHTLRGHMELLIPEVEVAALRLPKDDIPRYCALACIGEARGKLRATPGPGEHRALAYARKLSRSLAALCDHCEALTGVTMCLACDKPIKPGEDSQPYDHVSQSGGAASAGQIHSSCCNTVRRH